MLKINLSGKNKTFIAFSVVLFFTIYPRIQTYFLPLTERIASQDVYKEIANESRNYVISLYKGNITTIEQDKFTEEEYRKRIKDKPNILKKIQEKTKDKKAFWQNDNNQTYLLEFDPYYLYRYTKNLLQRGTISDKIKDGKLYDLYSYAPEGKYIIPSFIIYVGFFVHKVFALFNRDISLTSSLFAVPLILAILVSAAVFFFTKKIFGVFTAFFSSIIVTLTPIFLSRSMCGWYDTDCLNLLFPFLAVILFYFAIRQQFLIKAIGFISLSSLCIGLFALSWNGWWYFFYVILGGASLYTLNTLETYLRYKEKGMRFELQKMLILLALFIGLSIVFTMVIAYPERPLELLRSPLSILESVYEKQSVSASIWPNTYLTVAELRAAELQNVVSLAGNTFIFFVAIFGLFLLIKPRLEWDQHIQYLGFVFTAWAILTTFSALRAVRFSLLLAIPQGICFAVALKHAKDELFIRAKAYATYKRVLLKTLFFFALGLFISLIVLDRIVVSRNIFPSLDDDYVNVLKKIKEKSPTDTIVNSWWDYGTWYSAVGERRVVFDGATQHTPMAFWMGRVLMAETEEEAIGILRMINCASNNAFETLKKYGLSDIDAFLLLKKIIPIDKKEAEKLLQELLPAKKAEEILNYTHGETPPAYFIVDQHMVEIIRALSLLGNWSAEKTYIWQMVHSRTKLEAVKLIEEKFGYDKSEAANLYEEAVSLSNANLKEWATTLLQFNSPLSNGTKEDSGILFDNSVYIDLTTFNARVKTGGKDSWKRPYSLIYPQQNGFKEIVYEDADAPVTILLISEDNTYKSIILDQKLAKSMLVRLLFLKGHNLKHFKFLFSEKENGCGNINVWQIDWQGRQENNFPLEK